MATIEVKGQDGKKKSTLTLSEGLSSANPAMAVVHRAVVAEEANSRQGTQKAKTRSEVRGGGRKPYKQKKTGNARQGSIRAPHYKKGGMALAVSPRDYEKKVNRKERRAAILGALNAMITSGDVQVADGIVFAEAKTKSALDLLKAFELDKVRRVLVILTSYDEATYKCFRNISNVTVRTAPATPTEEAGGIKTAAFSARDVLVAHKILIDKDALTRVQEVWTK